MPKLPKEYGLVNIIRPIDPLGPAGRRCGYARPRRRLCSRPFSAKIPLSPFLAITIADNPAAHVHPSIRHEDKGKELGIPGFPSAVEIGPIRGALCFPPAFVLIILPF